MNWKKFIHPTAVLYYEFFVAISLYIYTFDIDCRSFVWPLADMTICMPILLLIVYFRHLSAVDRAQLWSIKFSAITFSVIIASTWIATKNHWLTFKDPVGLADWPWLIATLLAIGLLYITALWAYRQGDVPQ